MTNPSDAETEARTLVSEFFKDEPHKADIWWKAPNPSLGGVEPETMLKIGRTDKLLKIIKQHLEGISP